MLSNLRRLIRHPLGAAIALALVVLLGVGFVLSDRSGLGGGGGAKLTDADIVATVGGKTISVTDLKNAAQRDLQQIRQQRPDVTMAQYLVAGGLDSTLDRLITSTATRQFAESQGMVVSKRAVDGIIASAPGLQGIDGKFNQQAYDNALRAQGVSDAEARLQLSDQIQFRALMLPATSTDQVPLQLALPYSNLLLEKRSGQIGIIPAAAVAAGTPPGDAELTTYYQRNVGQYQLPERRQLRYALVSPASIAAQAAPSDAQVAAKYQADAASYAATDLRTISQVIVGDQQAANALAAKVRGGASLDAAAKAAGLAAATLKDQQQSAYAAQTAPDVARAAFAAKQGETVGPLKAPLGFVVLHIDATRVQPARSLADVRGDIVAALTKARAGQLLIGKRNTIDDALSNRTGFDTLVAQEKLSVQAVPAVTAAGVDIDNPTWKPGPELAPIVKAAFALDPADGPQTVPLGADGSFALVALDKIVPPAARPLAAIRESVAQDFIRERQLRQTRTVAAQVIAAIGKGSTLAQALAATGLKLPPINPVSGPRAQIINDPRNTPAPLILLFSMAPRTAKLSALPNGSGYAVIYLDSIVRGNASGQPQVVAGTRGDIGKVIGREYGDQLAKAIQQMVGTKKNEQAITQVKAQLSGASAPDQ